MDIRRLRYFVTVAGERSFTKAAEKLNIAQPPLSRRIQEIEEEVGAQLIERKSRPLRLTPDGRLFYEQALQVLERLDQMSSTMQRFVGNVRPRFVLGLIPSGFHDRLPQVIQRYRMIAPEIDLSLIEMNSMEQVEALKDGRIDAGLGRVRIEDDGIRRELLREEPVLAAFPPGSMLGPPDQPIDLSQISPYPVILYPRGPRPSYADAIVSMFRDYGIHLTRTIEVTELQTALIMVAAGEGACLIPTSARRLAHPEVLFRSIRPQVMSPIVLSHRIGDNSQGLKMLFQTFTTLYQEWGYPTPGFIGQQD
ncbi:LysR family transcriptional regulator [Novosphingobium resinovorum]|uniref:LysR family transcriptional regulator n=1 Tax=Novosphingobium resinovorum TaxID=158500 RepID=UPI003615EDEC